MRTVVDHDHLEPGVVYVIPSNRHVNVTPSEIDLQTNTEGRPKPSVDMLMSSAAGVGSVEDDGQGFDNDAGNGGVGLRSMRERAALLDGDLELDCEPGRGTRVKLCVPLMEGR